MIKPRKRGALAVDDRSGLVVPHSSLRKEWTGRMVSDDEYEDKHPQLRRRRLLPDGKPVKDPRPDDYRESAQIHLYTNGSRPLVASAWIGDVVVEIV